MEKFYRIKDEKFDFLVLYMDDEVWEEVAFRFAPCTNEEFLVQVLLRNGITKEVVEEILEIDFLEIERTFMIIETIKDFMHCNNDINLAKINFPGRELSTESSEKGREYRRCLDKYCDLLNLLNREKPEMVVLSDLRTDFPEIDCYFRGGYIFYAWNNAIL